MLNIRIVCVGRLKERFYHDAASEYLKRLSGYCRIEVAELAECRIQGGPSDSQVMRALEKEAAAIERNLLATARTVALCVEGREMTSRELSGMLAALAGGGMPRINFIVGGSYGLHKGIKAKADTALSMSKMTFPHNLARVMLLEQLYRAFTIIEGMKYDK